MEAVTVGKDQSQMGLKCPRCGSLNTKFCCYNNYSLTRPKYLCKTRRRYWTQGGNLRDVPLIIAPVSVNKKIKASKPCFNDFHCPSIGTLSSTTKNCTRFSNGDRKTGSSLKLHFDLVNSIEALISINHDMHLKLRQQRLAALGSLETAESSALSNHQMQKPKQSLPKEWCFDNCYVLTSASVHSGTGNHQIQRKDEKR